MTLIDKWPCVDPAYKTPIEAEVARAENFNGYPRMVWKCVDGHFHEGGG